MDRFDNIWKERLKEPETPALDWCTPSNQVWTGVAEEVFPPKDDRVFAWWWYGIGLILVGAVMFTYFLATSGALTGELIKTVPSKTETTKSALKAEVETVIEQEASEESISQEEAQVKFESKSVFASDLEKNYAVENAINSIDQDESIREITKSVEQGSDRNLSLLKGNTDQKSLKASAIQQSELMNARINDSANEKTIIEFQKAFTGLIRDDKASQSQLTSESTETVAADVSILTAATISNSQSIRSNQFAMPTMLERLKMLSAEDLSSEASFDLPSFVERSMIETTNNGLSIRLSSGVFEWRHKISSAFTNDLSAFDFNYIDNYGVFIRGDLEKKLSPLFAFAVGAEMDRVKIESGHNSALNYIIANEEDGLNENDYKLDLATPYGLMPAEFKFSRDQALTDDANLLVDFKNEHVIHNVRVPITFTITPFQGLDKWQFGLDAGMGFNYIAQLSNRVQSILTNHDDIHLQESSVTLSEQDFKRFHVDIFGTVFLERRFSDDWSLRTYYEYDWGQTKLFELGSYHTKVDRQYIGIGLSKILK